MRVKPGKAVAPARGAGGIGLRLLFLSLALAGLLVGPGLRLLAQDNSLPAFGRVKGFSAPDYYDPPYQNQIRSLLRGAEAEPQTNGQVLVRGLQLETYATNGPLQLTVSAPACLFDPKDKSASSTGHIEARSGDQRLFVSGEGFQWLPTNSLFIISNRVHTTLRRLPGTLNGMNLTNGTAISAVLTAPASGLSNAPALVETEIFAQRAELDHIHNIITYLGDVHVMDPTLELACEALTIKLAATDRQQLDSIVAETNVVIDVRDTNSQNLRIMGGKAVLNWAAANETVELTGDPVAKNADGELHGTVFHYNVLTQKLEVTQLSQIIRRTDTAGNSFLPALK
ncbi:MAG TPA: LptA/OstA family protein [Dongiaceae bacterium]|nr:LptA/OstA family protein [Dongiaceae bacterium]